MIQLIINTEVDLKPIQYEFGFIMVFIPEMIENTYLILINEKDEFDAIELAIEALGDVDIVGTYNMDGTQFQWVNPNSNRNHTIQKYTSKLRHKIKYDENGDIFTDELYTEAEAVNKQVNLIYGHPNRQLN